MVDILHNHVAQRQSLLPIIRLPVHLHNALTVSLQSAETASKGGFSCSVMPDDRNNTCLWKRQAVDIKDIPFLCVSKMKIFQFYKPFGRIKMHCQRECGKFKRPQSHLTKLYD